MLTIKTIIENTYAKWGEEIREKVGNNYSMDDSSTVSKFPYSSLYFLGLPTDTATLEGDEGTVLATLQVSVYTTGQRALTQAYEIDEVSHETLVHMGYRRNYGPELCQSTDPSIKRLLSRYVRVWGYGDSFPE